MLMTPYALPGGAAIVTALMVTAPAPGNGDASLPAVDAVERFLARPPGASQYRASRRLEAAGSGQRGWLDVDTSFTAASGLEYEVTAEGGSGYIRGRVLRRLLAEERRVIAEGLSPSVAISPANYQFEPRGVDPDGFAVADVLPRRRERSLIRGRMFLTLDGDLARIEGTLAKSPSFWVTRARVVRSYRRIEGAVMPVELETSAQLRLFGSSSLRMTYRYSHIDERPVLDDEAP